MAALKYRVLTDTETINEGSITYLYEMSKIASKVLSNDPINILLNENQMMQPIFERFCSLLHSNFKDGLTTLGNTAPVTKKEDSILTAHGVNIMLFFLVANEYSHSILGHLDTGKKATNDEHKKMEFEADELAYNITYTYLKHTGGPSREIHLSIEIAMIVSDFDSKYNYRVNGKSDEKHPSFNERLDQIRKLLGEKTGRIEYEKILRESYILQRSFEHMYSQFINWYIETENIIEKNNNQP